VWKQAVIEFETFTIVPTWQVGIRQQKTRKTPKYIRIPDITIPDIFWRQKTHLNTKR